MKISAMTTEQATDVLVKIAEPASIIMHDKKVFDMLERLSKSEAGNAVKFFADNITLIVTALLKDHKMEVYTIVAALAEKTAEEVAKQNIKQTVMDIKESWDGDLIDFFGSLK